MIKRPYRRGAGGRSDESTLFLFQLTDFPEESHGNSIHCSSAPSGGCWQAQYRSAAGEAMNASADLQVPLTSPRCGCMHSEMLPNVALGQNW
jgi:hypothetical protein